MEQKADIRADVGKNRIYIVLDGYFNDDQMKTVGDKTIEETRKLKPGFAVINDITKFKPTTPQGAEDLKRGQGFMKDYGMGRVIRITEGAALGQMQLSRKAKELGYIAEQAASIAEAERMLDG